MSNTENGLAELISSFEAMQKKFMDEAQVAFKAELVKFFDQYPEINVITWRQYTPYFNDGEECIFSVHEASFGFVEKDSMDDITRWGEFDGEDDKGWLTSYRISEELSGFNPEIPATRSQEVGNACDTLGSLIESGKMKNVMRAMFGDHVWILATREGFKVDELDHD